MVYTIGLTGDNMIIRNQDKRDGAATAYNRISFRARIWRDEDIANAQLLGSIYSFLADKT
jgi:hypothetical protein